MNIRLVTIFLIVAVLLLIIFIRKESNNNKVELKNYELTKEELIKHVSIAIIPSFENWILFKNGTYIIIEDTSEEIEIRAQGVEKMEEFGPVNAGGPAGDFGVTTLSDTDGWVVSGHGYGMYTYVHPSELDKERPEEYEIGLYGRGKRDLDGINPEIICISSNSQLIEIK